MGTRLRDTASNTDSSIILDSGTSYVKRDDQTVPVYRGVTSANLIGGLGGGLVSTHTFEGIQSGIVPIPALEGWQPGYKVVVTGVCDGAATYSDVTNGFVWSENRILTEPDPATGLATVYVQYKAGNSGTYSGSLSINESTGEITLQGFWGVVVFLSVYTDMGSASTAATQTNLDAALARITELESNAGGGGQMINVISGTEQSFYTDYQIPNWQTGDSLFWYILSDGRWIELVAGSGEQQVGHNLVQVSTTGLLKSRNVGDNTQGYITFFHMRGGINFVSRS